MEKVFENEELIIEIEDNAFVTFKGVSREDLSDNFCPDAELAVQKYLDNNKINAEAGRGYVYSEGDKYGVCVPVYYC